MPAIKATIEQITAAMNETNGNPRQASLRMGLGDGYITGRAHLDPSVRRIVTQWQADPRYKTAYKESLRRGPKSNQVEAEYCRRCRLHLTHDRVPTVAGQTLCAYCLLEGRKVRREAAT